MQVQRVQNNCINISANYTGKQNIPNINNISFRAGRQKLIAIATDSFNSESAKKMYPKIQKYYNLIGEYGGIKDIKLLQGKVHDYSSKPPFINYVDANVCLSINKREKNSIVKLYYKYFDTKKKDATIFEATLDKNGQMINGQFLILDNLLFERDKRNMRRMYSSSTGITYMPVGGNDKEWYCMDTIGSKKLSPKYLIDDSEQGALEIFLELARLKTSIM
jgi:hypothetical protein